MDLINADNVEPHNVDIAALEEQWFNKPDPYDLAETERVDDALQPPIIRFSRRFDTADYVKLNDPKLIALIKNVDEAGPGAATTTSVASKKAAVARKHGEWSIDSFPQNIARYNMFRYLIFQGGSGIRMPDRGPVS